MQCARSTMKIIVGTLLLTHLSTIVSITKGSPAYNCTNITVSYSELRYYNAPQTEGVLIFAKKNLENIFSSRDLNLDPYLLGLEGKRYNWWQVLLENGGRPGTLKTIQKSNASNVYTDSCLRPLPYKAANITDAYFYQGSDFRTFYREETAREAFVGTSDNFVHIIGILVWAPPSEQNDPRVYKISYALDDTGFWVRMEPELCRFDFAFSVDLIDKQPELYCTPLVSRPGYDSLPGNLLQALIG